jgi:protein involved in polysaccharide export with SLBB domain
MNSILNFRVFCTAFFLLCVVSSNLIAQTIPENVSEENIDNISDDALYAYYQQVKAQGYSVGQIKALAAARGISKGKIDEFEKRITSYNLNDNEATGETKINLLEISKDQSDNTFNVTKRQPKSKIFGKDFFANDNISFSPNNNLSTPKNYDLGPGDELVISIWGAAEQPYNVEVDREGNLIVPNIGPINVNGVDIDDATSKIKGALTRIYSGLSAPANSPYKINLSVSLSATRTVQVNIIGEVEKPGTYSLSSLSTVLNALYASGGPNVNGTFRNVRLVRNGDETIYFDLYQYLISGVQTGNVTLRDQDVIIIEPYLSRIAINGQVKRDGFFELKDGETLDDLLKYTSGFTSSAYKDVLLLKRIEGDRKKIVEINTINSTSEILKDGDEITVRSIIDEVQNKVEIVGVVYRPGVYEFKEGMTVADLIEKAAGIIDNAFVERAIISRSVDGVSVAILPFSLADVLNNGSGSIELKQNDVIRIYDKYALEEKSYLTIKGAINSPKRIQYIESLTIEDLILLAGGFSNSADTSKIDIYRKINGEITEQLVQTIRIGSNGLSDGFDSPFILQPNDNISVRYLKGYGGSINVVINGEVNYPGSYGIEFKEQRISDAIMNAGGLTQYSFAKGASLSRVNPFYKAQAQMEAVDDVRKNISNYDKDVILKNKPSLSVGIDLKLILDNPGSKYDMILKNGDVLTIPSIRETIKVEGEVLVPSLIRYDKSYSLKDYINNSGGFAENAKKSKTFVVYLNGSIAATKSFLFFKSYPRLMPGALIIVPNKPGKNGNNLSAQEIIGMTTGAGTLALLIQTIINK